MRYQKYLKRRRFLYSRRNALLLAVFAFLLGLVGTALFLLSRLGVPGFQILKSFKTHMGDHNPRLALKTHQTYHTDAEAVAENVFMVVNTNNADLYERIPAHIDTTFKWFPHYTVFSDDEASLNGVKIVDALSYYPKEDQEHRSLEAWRLRKLAQREQWGWHSVSVHTFGQLAAAGLYKFYTVPALAYAWSLDSSKDWYVMIKDNQIFLPSTLISATKNYDPSFINYIANAGECMILSRGAMLALFGSTTDTIKREIHESFETTVKSKHPNSVIEQRLLTKTEESSAPSTLKTVNFVFDSEAFQSNNLVETVAYFDRWCDPVGTFQFQNVWDLREIGDWYDSLVEYAGQKYTPTYYDFYRDFIMPHVTGEKKGWSAQTWSTNEFKNAVHNSETKTHEECRSACSANQKCYMWSFRSGKGCELVLNGVVAGTAFNSNKRLFDDSNTVAGYMTLRILQARRDTKCDPIVKYNSQARAEGWLAKVGGM